MDLKQGASRLLDGNGIPAVSALFVGLLDAVYQHVPVLYDWVDEPVLLAFLVFVIGKVDPRWSSKNWFTQPQEARPEPPAPPAP